MINTHEILTHQGYDIREGSSSDAERASLIDVARRAGAKLVGEIGFNIGLSSAAFLGSDPELRVVSFDLGSHPYINEAKRMIDERFPGRHTLITGDSRETVPNYGGERFDMAFVDGGHTPWVALADLRNMRPHCKEAAPIIFDDLTPWFIWGIGPTIAWKAMKTAGKVVEIERHRDGLAYDPVRRRLGLAARIWAVGHYTD